MGGVIFLCFIFLCRPRGRSTPDIGPPGGSEQIQFKSEYTCTSIYHSDLPLGIKKLKFAARGAAKNPNIPSHVPNPPCRCRSTHTYIYTCNRWRLTFGGGHMLRCSIAELPQRARTAPRALRARGAVLAHCAMLRRAL